MFVVLAAVGVLVPGCMSATSDPPPRPTVQVRGTVMTLSGPVLTVATITGPLPLRLVPPTRVSLVVASDRGHLNDGLYMGVTSVRQPDGSLRAIEVHIFPPGARRGGEGSYEWDLAGLGTGGRTVRNGTTSHGTGSVVQAGAAMQIMDGQNGELFGGTRGKRAGGTSLTLQFRSASMDHPQDLIIPWDVPIVKFEAGRRLDLKPGAHVFVIATRELNGELCVDRVLVGKNGLVPSL
jgi:hypothetical protein